jgi:uncharacterized protein YaaW (UPF0174 family)
MRSDTVKKILDETPQEVRDEVIYRTRIKVLETELTALHASYDKLVDINLKQSQELAKLRDLVHNPRHKQ